MYDSTTSHAEARFLSKVVSQSIRLTPSGRGARGASMRLTLPSSRVLQSSLSVLMVTLELRILTLTLLSNLVEAVEGHREDDELSHRRAATLGRVAAQSSTLEATLDQHPCGWHWMGHHTAGAGSSKGILCRSRRAGHQIPVRQDRRWHCTEARRHCAMKSAHLGTSYMQDDTRKALDEEEGAACELHPRTEEDTLLAHTRSGIAFLRSETYGIPQPSSPI